MQKENTTVLAPSWVCTLDQEPGPSRPPHPASLKTQKGQVSRLNLPQVLWHPEIPTIPLETALIYDSKQKWGRAFHIMFLKGKEGMLEKGKKNHYLLSRIHFYVFKSLFLYSIYSTTTFKYLLCPRFIINSMRAFSCGILGAKCYFRHWQYKNELPYP